MGVAVVTGAAGFIGSQLCARLLALGHEVRGIDNFDPYYDRRIKEANLSALEGRKRWQFQENNIAEVDFSSLLSGVDWVFHLAARAGVRGSWGADFSAYVGANITATQVLLEALRQYPVKKLVFASSSSVYGEGPGGPASEETPRRPISPYGVTKLAGEELVQAYYKNFAIPAVSLRYFTVYGPGQRPEMAFHLFLKAISQGKVINVYGDGKQVRNYTYVSDIVEANVLSAEAGLPGRIYNIGGGEPAVLLDVIARMEAIVGKEAKINYTPVQPGDPRVTSADISLARGELGYEPAVDLGKGLEEMAAWMTDYLRRMEGDRLA